MPKSVGSLYPPAAQRLAKYWFREYFVGFEHNEEKRKFIAYVLKELNGVALDEELVNEFQDFWGKGWIILRITEQDKELIES